MGNSATDRQRRRLTAAALGAFAIVAGACAAPPKATGPVLLHPVPPTQPQYTLEQGAIVYTDPGFTVAARPWDYRLVAAELRAAGEASPFGDDEEATGRFLFLRVRLENRSTQSLVFNPMRAWLVSEDAAPLLPLENSDLFVFADDRAAEAEARGRAFRRLCFDISTTVRPGASLERYLVFKAPAEPEKQYHLVLEDLWLGSTGHDLRFGFETFPGAAPADEGSPEPAAGPSRNPVSAPRPGP